MHVHLFRRMVVFAASEFVDMNERSLDKSHQQCTCQRYCAERSHKTLSLHNAPWASQTIGATSVVVMRNA